MHRTAKQLTYLLLFLAFWAIVIGGLWWFFFKPAPTCFDRRQNQGEEGVDCGGPCAQFCIPADLTPIRAVGAPRVFQPTPELVSILVRIENPNQSFAAQAFSYAIGITGDAGVATSTGTSFLAAGDITYLALLRSSAGIGRPLNATALFGNPAWVPAARFPKPALRVQHHETVVADDGSIRIYGTLASDDTLPARDITLIATFLGERGQVLGTSQTRLDTLSAGAATDFAIVHPPLSGIDPSSTQVLVHAVRQ